MMTFDEWWAKSIPFAGETDVETRLVKGVSRLSWAAASAEQHAECVRLLLEECGYLKGIQSADYVAAWLESQKP